VRLILGLDHPSAGTVTVNGQPYAQLPDPMHEVIVVLGALVITSEYSTGMVRTSLTVMPRRGTLYAAKAAVFAAVSLVVAFVASFGTFFLGRKHIANIFDKLGLAPDDNDNRRVIAALRCLDS
jgi:hypothetical protein